MGYFDDKVKNLTTKLTSKFFNNTVSQYTNEIDKPCNLETLPNISLHLIVPCEESANFVMNLKHQMKDFNQKNTIDDNQIKDTPIKDENGGQTKTEKEQLDWKRSSRHKNINSSFHHIPMIMVDKTFRLLGFASSCGALERS